MSGNIDESSEWEPEDGDDYVNSSVSELLEEDVFWDGSNVLLLGPMRRSLDDEMCTDLLRRQPVADRDVLFVSLTQSADNRIDLLRDHLETMPERVVVVSDADRFPSETTTATGDHGETRISVVVVSDPSDLPRLGMTISRAIEEWDDGDDDPLLCFHSLTALLQYVGPKRAFRFVHLLQNRIDAGSHYHMDVEAHDQRTIATLRPLFDVVVEYDADGNVTISD